MMGVFWNNFCSNWGIFLPCKHQDAGMIVFYSNTGIAFDSSSYDVHFFNFSDLPIWDRIFGTYRDTTEFADRCGFEEASENQTANDVNL